MTTVSNRALEAKWLHALGDIRNEEKREQSINLLSESYAHFLRGYKINATQILLEGRIAAGAATGQEITVGPLPFYSLCEHHMLPFFGTVEISYVANEYIFGLGKFPRVVEALSARLNLQETLTAAIADTLFEHLVPKKLAVTLEARHLCLEMRGTQTTGALLKTVKFC